MTITKSGELASFYTVNKAPIKHLRVYFSPKQAGEGDPSSENVREISGWDEVEVIINKVNKNLLDPSSFIGVNEYINASGIIHEEAPFSYTKLLLIKAGTYTLSGINYNSINSNIRIHSYNTDQIWQRQIAYQEVRTEEKYKLTFTILPTDKFIRISAPALTSVNPKFQLELGSSATVYEPYIKTNCIYDFNIGKNIINNSPIAWEIGSMDGSGIKNNRTTRIRTINFIKVQPNTTYTFSISNGYSFCWDEFTSNQHSVYWDWQTETYTFTTRPTTNQLFVIIKKDDTTNIDPTILKNDCHIQLEIGSTASTYEPYTTIYGGYVDLITGELVETYKKFTIDNTCEIIVPNSENEPWSHRWSIRKWDTINSRWLFQTNTNILYCDRLNKVSSAKQNGEIYGVTVEARIYLYDNEITTIEEFHNKYDGMELCAPASIPTVHQLSPQQLSTFIGTNNIWSNADRVEVEYDLAESNDELYRRRNILLRTPHIETATGNTASFTTDIIAPLKKCKIHFSPVQEGSGDVSLENVRPISGWNNIQVGLPSEYQRVEYLESTGNQYFWTDVLVQDGLTVESIQTFANNNDSYLFGGAANENNERTCFNGMYNLHIQGAYPKDYYNSTQTLSYDTIYTVKTTHINHTVTIYVNNALFYSLERVGTVPETGAKCICFGARRSDGTVLGGRYLYKGKVYSIIVSKNNKILANYIPCRRKGDDKPGMYDTITQIFYINEGSGDFTCGPNIEEQSLLVDWTDEVGTVYGGYVDLINGELVETYRKYNLGDLSVVTYGATSYDGNNGTNAMYYIANTGTGIGYSKGIEPIGDKIVYAGKNISGYYIGTWSNPDDYIWKFCINANNQLHVVFDNITVGITSDMTFAQRRAKITEWLQSNPITIVVPRQTPIIHSLTPQILKTLKGTNNIWSNTNGPIEIKYWTH